MDHLLQTSYNFDILRLHSSVEKREQNRIFSPPPRGKRKVIIATNIAETSITVSDVVHVIDAGFHRAMNYCVETNSSALETLRVAKSNVRQRRGRAGRCRPGNFFALYTRSQYLEMRDHEQPEMLRTPVESTVLQVKAMNLPGGSVSSILKKAIAPPHPRSVINALALLEALGAITRNSDPSAHEGLAEAKGASSSAFPVMNKMNDSGRRGHPKGAVSGTGFVASRSSLLSSSAATISSLSPRAVFETETLTPLGRKLANVPLHPTLARLYLMANLFSRAMGFPQLNEMAMAATIGMSGKSPFYRPPAHLCDAAQRERERQSEGTHSDHLHLAKVIMDFRPPVEESSESFPGENRFHQQASQRVTVEKRMRRDMNSLHKEKLQDRQYMDHRFLDSSALEGVLNLIEELEMKAVEVKISDQSTLSATSGAPLQQGMSNGTRGKKWMQNFGIQLFPASSCGSALVPTEDSLGYRRFGMGSQADHARTALARGERGLGEVPMHVGHRMDFSMMGCGSAGILTPSAFGQSQARAGFGRDAATTSGSSSMPTKAVGPVGAAAGGSRRGGTTGCHHGEHFSMSTSSLNNSPSEDVSREIQLMRAMLAGCLPIAAVSVPGTKVFRCLVDGVRCDLQRDTILSSAAKCLVQQKNPRTNTAGGDLQQGRSGTNYSTPLPIPIPNSSTSSGDALFTGLGPQHAGGGAISQCPPALTFLVAYFERTASIYQDKKEARQKARVAAKAVASGVSHIDAHFKASAAANGEDVEAYSASLTASVAQQLVSRDKPQTLRDSTLLADAVPALLLNCLLQVRETDTRSFSRDGNVTDLMKTGTNENNRTNRGRGAGQPDHGTAAKNYSNIVWELRGGLSRHEDGQYPTSSSTSRVTTSVGAIKKGSVAAADKQEDDGSAASSVFLSFASAEVALALVDLRPRILTLLDKLLGASSPSPHNPKQQFLTPRTVDTCSRAIARIGVLFLEMATDYLYGSTMDAVQSEFGGAGLALVTTPSKN
ncbi:unnamed protein product [Amoebophrya sp. A25]|nr:unnamed protein product [Amoebophrya sp. A25]|eukprot:GSA25T00021638001.1